jgi:hypothetical protein
MQITVTITDKAIKSAIDNALDGSIYDYYDSATLKAAKIPKAATAVKAVFDNPKFQATLTKQLQRIAESAMEDEIHDAMWDIEMPGVSEMTEACEAAVTAHDEKWEQEREAAEVARMVKTLEKAGFKIVKA